MYFVFACKIFGVKLKFDFYLVALPGNSSVDRQKTEDRDNLFSTLFNADSGDSFDSAYSKGIFSDHKKS